MKTEKVTVKIDKLKTKITMKNLLLISVPTIFFFVTSLMCGFGCTSNATQATAKEIISFYDVPLVCPAAPKIGCGTKSKPILLEMEKKSSIKEAWLNREGTVIAIVWNENASSDLRTTTVDSIFKENKMDAKLIIGKDYEKMITSFEEKKKWYRGVEVDKLSLEEKDIIIQRLLDRINDKTPLSLEKTQSLKIEFATALKNRFTKTYSSEINSNSEESIEKSKKEIENELLEIGKKYLNETEMNSLKEAITLGLRPTESDNHCSKKDNKKKSCCSKKH